MKTKVGIESLPSHGVRSWFRPDIGGGLHLRHRIRMLLAMLAVALAGCAANPAGIQADFVSPEIYSEYSCSTLESLKADKREEIDELYKAQKTKRIVDGFSNVLLIPGAASVIEDSSKPLARSKGEFMAILSEYDRRCVAAVPLAVASSSERVDRSSSLARQRRYVEPSVFLDFARGEAPLAELPTDSTDSAARSARARSQTLRTIKAQRKFGFALDRQMHVIDELAGLEASEEWGRLIQNTVEAGCGNDIGWYYLGIAAAKLEMYDVAETYLQRSVAASRTVESACVECGGHELPEDANNLAEAIRALSAE